MSVLLYLSSIVIANLLVIYFGVVSIGPLVFPAGAVVVGLTFSIRDYVQKKYGKWGCWKWMLLATVITYFLNKNIALASVSAFIISELIDWVVFTFSVLSFRKRIMLSNLFSTPVDSFVFVSIAFGFAWPIIIGQTIVKFLSSGFVLLARRTN